MTETTSLFESTDVDEISASTTLSTPVTVSGILSNTTTTVGTPNFTWIIQTITPPPAVIISTDYGYYYLYSFYCCLSLLFLISMILLSVKLSTMRRNANKTVRRCDATVSYNPNVNTTTSTTNVTPGIVQPFDDLPPKYDDLGIVNLSMDMSNLEMV